MTYAISVRRVEPRALASVHARMAVRDVPAQFRSSLDQVYAAAKRHAIALDGQNVFVYRAGPTPLADVEFGVGVTGPFAPVGRVVHSSVPGGEVATTTHWGDYAALGAAHDAVVTWCRENGRALADAFIETQRTGAARQRSKQLHAFDHATHQRNIAVKLPRRVADHRI